MKELWTTKKWIFFTAAGIVVIAAIALFIAVKDNAAKEGGINQSKTAKSVEACGNAIDLDSESLKMKIRELDKKFKTLADSNVLEQRSLAKELLNESNVMDVKKLNSAEYENILTEIRDGSLGFVLGHYKSIVEKADSLLAGEFNKESLQAMLEELNLSIQSFDKEKLSDVATDEQKQSIDAVRNDLDSRVQTITGKIGELDEKARQEEEAKKKAEEEKKKQQQQQQSTQPATTKPKGTQANEVGQSANNDQVQSPTQNSNEKFKVGDIVHIKGYDGVSFIVEKIRHVYDGPIIYNLT